MKTYFFALAGLVLFSLSALGKFDKWYVEKAKAVLDGESQKRLSDDTQCDLVTKTHAYEVEKAPDWKYAVGQSLHYAHVTGCKAGIILVMTSNTCKDPRYYRKQLEAVIEEYGLPIDVEIMSKSGILCGFDAKPLASPCLELLF